MGTKKYVVLIYPKAESDLKEIKAYFENELSISSVNLFKKFLKVIDRLEENPFLFPLVKDPYLSRKGYRTVLIDNYLLFFVITEKTVQIHRFLYGKRLYSQIL